MPHLAVRPARPEDVGEILAMIRELAEYEREPHAVTATHADLHQALFGRGFGRGPVCEAFVGELDGAAQGFALFFMNFSTWKGRAGLYLEDLYVRPACRGCGLGAALLARLARTAVDRGCPRMEWIVLDWNAPAHRVYQSVGAVPLDGWTVWRLAGEPLAALADRR